jgi:PmbA protein
MTWLDEILGRAETLLARKKIAHWELCADILSDAAVEVMDGKIHAVERSFERTMGIRILDRGLGFMGLTDPSDDADLEEAIDAAHAEAKRARPAAITAFAGKTAIRQDADFFDARATGELRELLESSALELETLALNAAPNIARVRPARVEEQRGSSLLRTSSGAEARDRHTRAFAMLGAIAEDEEGAQSAFGSDSAPAIEALDLVTIAKQAANDASRMLGAGSFETARVPVIFGYEAASELYSMFVEALDAERLEHHASFLAKLIHTQALSEVFTFTDDPHDGELDGATWFDGEGLATEKLILIERGTIKAVLDDRDSAARAKRTPTAHGVRSGANARPRPGVHNLSIDPGQESLAELLRRAEGGLYVHSLSGTHTMNEVTGELSLGASGWKIAGGALGEAIEGAAVAGSLVAMFAGPISLSSERKRLGGMRVPVMLIEEAQVSAASDV